MARVRTGRTSALAFEAITVEGALISAAMLGRIARHEADEQTGASYSVPKGLTLRDEIARYFRIGQALHAEFAASKSPSLNATINFVEKLLHDVLGFGDLRHVGARTLADRKFAVTLEGLQGRVPIVVVPPVDDLDRPSTSLASDVGRRSAASALQDWLNASGDVTWGICCNGSALRLVRANTSLTRPAYVEGNLQRIFADEAFADFAALWLLMHASRFGQVGSLPSDCALERWRDAGQKEGVTARDRLRDSVEAALLSLGNGFLSDSDNSALRERLRKGELPLPDFFGQLLRLVYRLIFLLAAEDRNLLHPPSASVAARKLYAEGYSVSTLRDRAVRRAAWDRHHDRWEGLLITFAALERGERRLGLPALGGLFAPGTLPDLETARVGNRGLMEATYRLAWLKDDSGLVPVNWRDMETEELGSVYESLLELTPRLTNDGRGFAFAEGGEAQGHARKTSGSYYTPDSLVQALLDSALDPVLDRVEAEADDPAAALLSVTVLDPACGSGHFLLAAARRIATRLARARAGGVASPADFRRALRDVVRACVYGVDRNPMAVELTKVALWIETVEPGKPLGFLDANIRCGNSLLGVFDLKALEQGIPDAAYKQLAGDDKDAAKIAARINRGQREAATQHDLALSRGADDLVRAARAVAAMPEDDLASVRARARAYEAVHAESGWSAKKTACDLYVAAFLSAKHFRVGALARAQTPDRVPTTLDVRTALAGRQPDGQLVARAVELSVAARAFHWPLEFPAIMAAENGRGRGFDAVLGNPPWERIKLQEQEFFASREPEIAEAPTAAARERSIARLKEAAPGTRERALYDEFEAAKRSAEAESVFARVEAEDGGRFPLTGRGDVNTYALFTELFASLASKRGRAGVIVPTGIATDANTAPFFAALVSGKRLVQIIDFENRERLFPAIDSRMKFSLLTIGREVQQPDFAFFLTNTRQIAESERHFTLSTKEIECINPDTKTAPIFRTTEDARLAKRIHLDFPVIAASKATIDFYRCIDVNKDSRHLVKFSRKLGNEFVPLIEGKLLHFFDHRAASYSSRGDERGYRVLPPTTLDEHADPNFRGDFFWSVARSVVEERLPSGWKHDWLIAYKDISSATNERTLIGCIVPRWGTDYSVRLCFPSGTPEEKASFLGMINSLVFDFVLRQKINGLHISDYLMKQMPICSLSSFSPGARRSIVSFILELSYTSHDLRSFARDLDYDGLPFAWDEDHRAQLRAGLDAWFARAYGLTRDELRYVLDPADVKGPDYPSETFRVLKKNEIARFGEYRTARLVLSAYDELSKHPIAAE
jgi:hypothetical protein